MADFDQNGYLSTQEMDLLFTSLLRAREKLIVTQSSDVVATGRKKHETQSERWKHLKARDKRYLESKSIDELLKIEARMLTEIVMKESKAKHSRVTKEQFEAWAQNGSEASLKALDLFSVFSPSRFFNANTLERRKQD